MKTRFWVALATIPATFALLGPAARAADDAGLTAAADAGPAVTDTLAIQLTSADGGPLELDGGVPIDADLAVHLEPRLVDVRVRLTDANAHQVPATANVRLTAHTDVLLHPDALQPGTRYHLAVEPDVSDSIRDAQGHAYSPTELGFRTAGEPPAKSPPSKSGKRHKHRARP